MKLIYWKKEINQLKRNKINNNIQINSNKNNEINNNENINKINYKFKKEPKKKFDITYNNKKFVYIYLRYLYLIKIIKNILFLLIKIILI